MNTEFPNQQHLWNWINERHAIYLLRKQGEPPPWTEDQILREFRFCNVFRELDTVTIWIRKHWREQYADHINLWFMMALARLINWPATLNELTSEGYSFPDEFVPDEFLQVFAHRRGKGEKIFGGAYVITNGGSTLPKEEFILQASLMPLWQRQREWLNFEVVEGKGMTIHKAWNWFRETSGFGPFIAYEVVTDLRHTRYLNTAKDIMSWANAGPGAKRGLNRLLGRHPDYALKQQDALHLMRLLLATANAQSSPVGAHVPLPLEMRDIEHSLCETDKYLRALTGEGRPKNRYDYEKSTAIS